MRVAVARKTARGEFRGGGARGGRGGIHHAARRTQLPGDGAGEQRKMRAAEHHRVHARIEVREIPLGHGIDRLALAPALLGQRDENLRRNLRDMRVGPHREDGAFVGAALHRALGREHGDAAAGDASQAARAPGSMTPMTGNVGNRSRSAGSARGRRGIAGDHQRLDAARSRAPRRRAPNNAPRSRRSWCRKAAARCRRDRENLRAAAPRPAPAAP